MDWEMTDQLLQWSQHLVVAVTSIDWTLEKVSALVGIFFGFVGTSTTIYLRWRNTGRRLVSRLREFIESEDVRLDGARTHLFSALDRPSLQPGKRRPERVS
jgi:hypothetical protein